MTREGEPGAGGPADAAALRREVERLRAERAAIADANARAAELMVELELARDAIAAAKAELHDILDHVDTGFFTVGPDLRVRDGHSAACLALFDRPAIASLRLPAILRLDDDASAHVELLVGQVFDEVLPADVALAQLPDRYRVGDRWLEFHTTALRNAEGAVRAIMFAIHDATELEAQRREARVNRALVEVLRHRAAFSTFLREARELLRGGRDAVLAGEIQLARHAVHTLKGNAGAYGLDDVVHECHRVESAEVDVAGLARIAATLRAFIDDHASVLPFRWDAALPRPTHHVGAEELDVLEEALDAGNIDAAYTWLRQTTRLRARELLGPVEAMVRGVAARLGRPIRLELEGVDERVDRRFEEVLRGVPHLLRNAVVHGIEDDRGEKPATGLVRLTIATHGGGCRIAVEDDGAGVNEAALRNRLQDPSAVAPGDLLRLLARDGLSSTPEATLLAGRGVGVTIVARAVEALGGTMNVDSRPGEGTTITLVLPPRRIAGSTKPPASEPHRTTQGPPDG